MEANDCGGTWPMVWDMLAASVVPILMNEEFLPPVSSAGAAPRRQIPAVGGLGELVAQMAQGSQEAFAGLYDQTSPMVNGLLLRILERPEDAEEVMLDVYMKAWKYAGRYTE